MFHFCWVINFEKQRFTFLDFFLEKYLKKSSRFKKNYVIYFVQTIITSFKEFLIKTKIK